jgi:uncharacterized protein (TIGR02284 family)
VNAKSIADIVSDLLQTLEDGKEGFRKAAEAARDPDLKALFAQYANDRAQMNEELVRLMRAETEEKKQSAQRAVDPGEIDVKTALTCGDDFTILAECERGEDRAVEMFRKALEEDLPPEICQAIKSQSVHILQAHDKIKELRDTAQPIL